MTQGSIEVGGVYSNGKGVLRRLVSFGDHPYSQQGAFFYAAIKQDKSGNWAPARSNATDPDGQGHITTGAMARWAKERIDATPVVLARFK